MKKLFSILMSFLMLLSVSTPYVDAHSTLLNTEPKRDGTVTSIPKQVKIWFNEPIDPASIIVTDKNGLRVDLNDAAVSKESVKMINVSLKPSLKQGVYQVNWSILSADGDPVKGSFKFTIAGKQQESVEVKVNGKMILFPDAEPFVDKSNGRTMVPVRFVAQQLGAVVSWDVQKQEVTMTQGKKVIKLIVGQKKANVNGHIVTFDATASLKDQRTYVPVRFISETFGAKVNWEGATNTVIITKR